MMTSLAQRSAPARDQPVRLGTRRRASPSVSELVRVVADELARREREIDAGDGLLSITVIVRIDERTGKPGRVLFRTESENDLREGR
jgi:hypothetical protein